MRCCTHPRRMGEPTWVAASPEQTLIIGGLPTLPSLSSLSSSPDFRSAARSATLSATKTPTVPMPPSPSPSSGSLRSTSTQSGHLPRPGMADAAGEGAAGPAALSAATILSIPSTARASLTGLGAPMS